MSFHHAAHMHIFTAMCKVDKTVVVHATLTLLSFLSSVRIGPTKLWRPVQLSRDCLATCKPALVNAGLPTHKHDGAAGKVAAGSVQKAVITETKKEIQRRDGSIVKFHKNACVLVNQKGQPIGTRVLGFATHELRTRGLLKILSLAARVL